MGDVRQRGVFDFAVSLDCHRFRRRLRDFELRVRRRVLVGGFVLRGDVQVGEGRLDRVRSIEAQESSRLNNTKVIYIISAIGISTRNLTGNTLSSGTPPRRDSSLTPSPDSRPHQARPASSLQLSSRSALKRPRTRTNQKARKNLHRH